MEGLNYCCDLSYLVVIIRARRKGAIWKMYGVILFGLFFLGGRPLWFFSWVQVIQLKFCEIALVEDYLQIKMFNPNLSHKSKNRETNIKYVLEGGNLLKVVNKEERNFSLQKSIMEWFSWICNITFLKSNQNDNPDFGHRGVGVYESLLREGGVSEKTNYLGSIFVFICLNAILHMRTSEAPPPSRKDYCSLIYVCIAETFWFFLDFKIHNLRHYLRCLLASYLLFPWPSE